MGTGGGAMATDENGALLTGGSSPGADVPGWGGMLLPRAWGDVAAWFAQIHTSMAMIAVATSVAFHGLLLLCLVSAPTRIQGANGRSLDAIGVELIDAAALDIAVPRDIPDGQVTTGASHARTEPTVPEPITGETVRAAPGAVSEATAAPAAIVGGAAVSGGGQDDASARSAAALGPAAARYALTVREAIGRARPRHYGVKGHVEVAFGLSALGLVRFAEVTRTSGIGRLDEAALKAVHTASFPTPPVGLTESHLSFVVPFNFR